MEIKKQKKIKAGKVKPVSKKQTGNPNIAKLIIAFKQWILIIEVAVILGLGYFFLIAPQLQFGIGEDGQSLTYWEDELAAAEQALVDAQSLVAVYNKLSRQDREKLQRILPSGEQVPLLMSQIEALFESEQLFLTSFSAFHLENSILTPAGMEIVSIEMGFLAPQDYQTYKSLLEKLESHVRLLDIRTVEYSPGNNTFTISAFAYFTQ